MVKSKRLLAFIFALIIFSTTWMTVSAADECKSHGTVTASLLNIRKAATTSSAIVGQIPNGQKVGIRWLEKGWARITYNGIEGYVSLDYLKVVNEPLPSRGQAVSSKGQAVVEAAKKYLGVPYVYGGTSPSGFDCSGFVYYIYKSMGVTLNRVAADQMRNGTWVAPNALQPGDIIGFTNKSGYVSHVGIYVGGGQMLHCGSPISYANVNSPYWQEHFYCFGRLP